MPDRPIAARSRLLSSTLWCFGLAACAFGLRLGLPGEWIERYYSRGVYLVIREGLDLAFGWWPVAASGPWLIAAFGFLGYDAYRQARLGATAYAKTVRGAAP